MSEEMELPANTSFFGIRVTEDSLYLGDIPLNELSAVKKGKEVVVTIRFAATESESP